MWNPFRGMVEMNRSINQDKARSTAFGRDGRLSRASVIVACVAMLVACNLQGPSEIGNQGRDDALPADVVSDTSRTFSSETFDFNTLPPVELQFSFIDAASEPLGNVIVTLSTSTGERVYRGRSDSSGVLTDRVVLPTNAGDIELTAEKPGYAPRKVIIEEMARLATVDRVMALGEADGSTSQSIRASGNDADSDGDGVPDYLDDFPDDPNASFLQRVPAEDTITVAFEDLYPRYQPEQDPGDDEFFDADFNDFVASYSVEEIRNENNNITRISGEATAVARLAGYEHRFGMRFRFDGSSAELEISVDGNTTTKSVDDVADIVLFENSASDVGKTASFTLTFDDPVERDGVTAAPYDPYIYVYDTGEYIHRIGMDPHPDAGPSDGDDWNYQHPDNGMPWALLVPTDWQYPGEMVFIEDVYPAFQYWRESFGEHYADWYEYYKEDPGAPGVVTYDGNNEESGTPPVDETEYEEGDEVEVLGNSGDLRKAGHGFVGWNSEADGSGEFYEVGSTFTMPAESVTLYAEWKGDYEIGDRGPAGGWVFYDHGELHDDGWRFLEAAPGDIVENGDATFAWSDVTDAEVGASSTAIGAGWENTQLIVDHEDHEVSAALRTREYTVEHLGGTFEEWFLPSEDELNEMYATLHDVEPTDYGFLDERYWSSTEVDAGRARLQNFATAGFLNRDKDNEHRIRSIRAF